MISMLTEKRDHLPAYLQLRNVGIQVNAIQALQIEHDMPIDDLIDVAHLLPRCVPPTKLAVAIIALYIRVRKRHSAVRGWHH